MPVRGWGAAGALGWEQEADLERSTALGGAPRARLGAEVVRSDKGRHQISGQVAWGPPPLDREGGTTERALPSARVILRKPPYTGRPVGTRLRTCQASAC